MKKALKVLKRLFGGFIVFILFVSVSVFGYHRYQLGKESEAMDSKGTFIEFQNKKLNVYNKGDGEDTFVFMSGSGIAAPVYEMKGLYSKFLKENKIAVVERAGYGYSDVFEDNRDIDTILEQTRNALIQSGSKPPYILMPHSISGIEAIYWAQKYPNEVKAIIALDIGLPKQYVKHKLGFLNSLTIRGMNLLTKIGFHRLAPSLTYNPEVIKQTFLKEHEKEMYKAISYKQTFNDDMEQELLHSYENSKKCVNLPIPKETPILFVDAYQDKNSKYAKQSYKDYKEFAEQLFISDVIQIKSTHSIYLYFPDEIYNLSTDFINKKVRKMN
ncbi:alpha/beta hydrolase [Niallia sp. NCCP-28]|uniref:alpha/beta hydrolase n=1 Tax=Niallia sp. NCCP-28 TaxID=2934712 RepID=UPI00207E862A|nr:alpha/beta hydrolase [Niallia sp. NCCP-28]GKU84034.1 hydrolase [Niallia sp. NCCP-28]